MSDIALYPKSFVLPANSPGVGSKCFICDEPLWAGVLTTFLLLIMETDLSTLLFHPQEKAHAAHFVCAEEIHTAILNAERGRPSA